MLRNTAAVIAIGVLLAASGADDTPASFKSRSTQRAQETYNRTISDARRDYLSRATAVTEVYMRALESAMRGATKRGDLDEANLVKQEHKDVQIRLDKLKIDMFASEIDHPAMLEITGTGFTLERMGNKQVAFSDRGYIWFNVPAKFEGWKFTRNSGPNGAKISIKVKRTGMVFLATGGDIVKSCG